MIHSGHPSIKSDCRYCGHLFTKRVDAVIRGLSAAQRLPLMEDGKLVHEIMQTFMCHAGYTVCWRCQAERLFAFGVSFNFFHWKRDEYNIEKCF
ncbi:hypothetical protein CEXT_249621 [Caerostris extrusa]|uniref:Uncharacterized protein n=1 Tax=Caerostris extrusa TaxID=172846 RepID=A0AAV4UH65_CAEEX|nr:hypothetical protein CEXT_249621 [Caerostris extrusa]